jgi:biotin operon repressor
MTDRWLSVEEIADYLGVSRDTVYGWMSCCRFRGHEVKIVTKESEIGNETEVYERVQV